MKELEVFTDTDGIKEMKELVPYERQMLMAEAFHYAWYNQIAFNELKDFLNKWGSQMGRPILFINKNNDNESTNTGA